MTSPYEYVATHDIYEGQVCVFREGDPVPGSHVEEFGYLDDELVVHRDDYEGRNPDEPPMGVMQRGDMPPHLQDSAVVEKPSDAELTRPMANDNKDSWIAYASDSRQPDDLRLTEDEASAMSKQALMDRFKD